MFHVKHLKYWVLGLFLAIFISCGEDVIEEPEEPINKVLQSRKDIKSAKEVMLVYYEFMWPGTDNDFTIEEEKLPRDRTKVTLIRDNIKDDSMKGEKIMMLVKHDGEKWKVITIERNWKCYKGRGHTEWGTEPCN